MKRLILFGGLFMLLFATSCEKEIIKPNNCSENVNFEDRTQKISLIQPTSSTTDSEDPGITDPNDDDYSNRNPGSSGGKKRQ